MIGALAGTIGSIHAQVPQTGAVAGRVISVETGDPVAGAIVAIAGREGSASSDLNGAFRIEGVDEGTYDLSITRDGFRRSQVAGLQVVAGVTARTNVPLEPIRAARIAAEQAGRSGSHESDVIELEPLTVQGTAAAGSAVTLLADRQKAPALSDAIGEDMISRLGVGDAAEAMTKVTGASIVDGKYVLVRGLGDRYSNTLLNGMTVPSADPDRRAVQMDQFPSSLLESIVTSKSFTPDQPGGFSGGSVNLRTKSFPDHFFFSLGSSISYDSAATGQDVLTIPGGGSDWLGRDDGTRALPKDLPDHLPSPADASRALRLQHDPSVAEEVDRIANSFHNETYFPRTKTAKPNYGFSFATGDRLSLGGERELGYVFSLTYDRTTTNYTGGSAGRYSQGSFNPDSPLFADSVLVYSPNLADYNFAEQYAANPDVPGRCPVSRCHPDQRECRLGRLRAGCLQAIAEPRGDIPVPAHAVRPGHGEAGRGREHAQRCRKALPGL